MKARGGEGTEPVQGGRTRPSRRVLLLASAAITALSVWACWLQREHAALPSGVDAKSLSYPREVLGETARTPAELEYLLQRERPGVRVEVGAARAVVAAPATDDVAFAATLIGVLAYAALAAFVLVPRTSRAGIADLTAGVLATALAIAIGGVWSPRRTFEHALPWVYAASLALWPVCFVRFALAFPRPVPFLRGRAVALRLAFLPALGVAAWNGVAWTRAFAAEGARGVAATGAPTTALYALLVVGTAVGCAVLARNARRGLLDRERRQALWILWGIAIGATPFVLLRALPRMVAGTEVPFPPVVDRVVEWTVPLAFGVAVARERFLDIDVIVRRSVLYTILALLATGLFAGALLVLGTLGARLGWPEPLVWAVAAALPAAAFQPARGWVASWLDRAIFQIRYGHARALASLEAALVAAPHQEAVAARLRDALREALDPRPCHVFTRVRGEWRPADPVSAEVLAAVAAFERLRDGEVDGDGGAPPNRTVALPGTTALPEIETPAFAAALTPAGIVLVQPATAANRVLGLILLGPRANGRTWVAEDVAFLAAAGEAVGAALDRLDLVQRVAEEEVARRSLDDLARRKADFFARLSHDLRSPLTAVRWSAGNLVDGLAGPVTEGQADYLRSIVAAAGQLGRLVDNLVDLSRLDLRAPPRPPEPVDLRVVVEEAVTALRPIAMRRDVRIEVAAPETLPMARGRRDAAQQVVLNLLDNALKYAPAKSAVEIALAREPDGFLALTVRDKGPGLPVEGRDRLFDLFAQGPEGAIEGGKGYGIGLYVVREWTRAMGGTVTVDDPPGGGARFRCRFPRWQEEPSWLQAS